MRRRLTASLVSMVVATLVVVGVVFVVVEARAANTRTRHQLLNEATHIARTVKAEASRASTQPARAARDPAARLRVVLRVLTSPLALQGEAVVAVLPNGSLIDPAAPRLPPRLPRGVTKGLLDSAALLHGRATSGVAGGVVYAAAPFTAPLRLGDQPVAVTQVVVLTQRSPSGLVAAWPWLLLAAGVIVAVAVGVADRLGRRIVAPLRSAESVTGRIAAGDLDARVPDPPGTDPELASLIGSVNTMAGALATSRAAERDFLLSVTHELRTPLTSIRGYAEAIDDGAAEPKAAAGVILRESGRLERLVDDLLELAKLRSSAFGVRREAVDLGDLVVAVSGAFLPAAAEVGVELVADVPAAAVTALADPDRVAQIAANLIENSLRYARRRVVVGVGAVPGGVVVWVDDDGPGVAPAALPHLFDRLFTTSDQHGRHVGSGLGLAIVAQLVTAMGGQASARSPLTGDGGTRLVVTLPST